MPLPPVDLAAGHTAGHEAGAVRDLRAVMTAGPHLTAGQIHMTHPGEEAQREHPLSKGKNTPTVLLKSATMTEST